MPSCSACEPDASRGCEKEDPGGLEIRRAFNMGVDEFGGDGLDRGEADLVDELAHLLDGTGASTVAPTISLLLSYSGAARPLPFLTARTHPRPSPTTLRARGGGHEAGRGRRTGQRARAGRAAAASTGGGRSGPPRHLVLAFPIFGDMLKGLNSIDIPLGGHHAIRRFPESTGGARNTLPSYRVRRRPSAAGPTGCARQRARRGAEANTTPDVATTQPRTPRRLAQASFPRAASG